MKTLSIAFFLVVLQTITYAQKSNGYGALKMPDEKVLFSFKLKNSSKIVLICTGKNDEYLVYRFGNKEKVELQYPSVLNTKSWNLFHYSGYSRGGGAKNDATEQHSLSFSTNKVTYKVYDDWDSGENRGEAFVTVVINGKETKIKGEASSKKGSLGLLRNNETLIHNYYWDESQ